MARIVLAVGMACYVALATGEVTAFESAFCAEQCPDDDSTGQCPPSCADCACCPHHRLMAVAAELTPPVPQLLLRIPERPQLQPPTPEPGDILHVPKSALA